MTTPGVSSKSDWKLRPFSGRFDTNCLSTTVLTAGDVGTLVIWAATVTVSPNPAMASRMLIDCSSPTFRTSSDTSAGANPLSTAFKL